MRLQEGGPALFQERYQLIRVIGMRFREIALKRGISKDLINCPFAKPAKRIEALLGTDRLLETLQ